MMEIAQEWLEWVEMNSLSYLPKTLPRPLSSPVQPISSTKADPARRSRCHPLKALQRGA